MEYKLPMAEERTKKRMKERKVVRIMRRQRRVEELAFTPSLLILVGSERFGVLVVFFWGSLAGRGSTQLTVTHREHAYFYSQKSPAALRMSPLPSVMSPDFSRSPPLPSPTLSPGPAGKHWVAPSGSGPAPRHHSRSARCKALSDVGGGAHVFARGHSKPERR